MSLTGACQRTMSKLAYGRVQCLMGAGTGGCGASVDLVEWSVEDAMEHRLVTGSKVLYLRH